MLLGTEPCDGTINGTEEFVYVCGCCDVCVCVYVWYICVCVCLSVCAYVCVCLIDSDHPQQ